MVEATTLYYEETGEKYIGETLNGEPHGNGIYYDEDGIKVYHG